jgi:hypothetical protein
MYWGGEPLGTLTRRRSLIQADVVREKAREAPAQHARRGERLLAAPVARTNVPRGHSP